MWIEIDEEGKMKAKISVSPPTWVVWIEIDTIVFLNLGISVTTHMGGMGKIIL